MRYFLEFISKQPKGYISQIADTMMLSYNEINSALVRYRKKKTISDNYKRIFCEGISRIEQKEYNQKDFIW